jgi:hypothetical protein
MYIGVYTVHEKAVIGVIAHNPYIFHDFYGNNIFKFAKIQGTLHRKKRQILQKNNVKNNNFFLDVTPRRCRCVDV